MSEVSNFHFPRVHGFTIPAAGVAMVAEPPLPPTISAQLKHLLIHSPLPLRGILHIMPSFPVLPDIVFYEEFRPFLPIIDGEGEVVVVARLKKSVLWDWNSKNPSRLLKLVEEMSSSLSLHLCRFSPLYLAFGMVFKILSLALSSLASWTSWLVSLYYYSLLLLLFLVLEENLELEDIQEWSQTGVWIAGSECHQTQDLINHYGFLIPDNPITLEDLKVNPSTFLDVETILGYSPEYNPPGVKKHVARKIKHLASCSDQAKTLSRILQECFLQIHGHKDEWTHMHQTAVYHLLPGRTLDTLGIIFHSLENCRNVAQKSKYMQSFHYDNIICHSS
ncbi:hypothetical protein AXF42_Ash007615 [Apostasia shenzhenica]|uniref:Uncharacterized protein n=1 Tax=Apostasia shenzhenica TaxID=1088818 RepID=A0A2I0A5Y8_9ASPA|nr:hypothetical protein AXF42_Ash007615 [Apostasia shenzhenica]